MLGKDNNTVRNTGLKAISLFSGAGGFDIGFERSGCDIVFANEIDDDTANTWMMNRKNNDAPIMHTGDINAFMSELNDFTGEIDVMFGGPPCQGFSLRGKMDPNDPRSQMIWRFMDAVDIVHPKTFVIENVAALGRASRWEQIRNRLMEKGESLGYDVSYRIHVASEHGVPQKRERVFFIGIDRAFGISANDVHECLLNMTRESGTLRNTLLSCGEYGSDDNPITCNAKITLSKNPVLRRSPYNGMLLNGARPLDIDGLSHTLPATMGGNMTPVIDENCLRYGNENWFVEYRRRLLANKTRPCDETVPSYLRRLTLKEASAIQTFPEWYSFCGANSKIYRQIGNAVPCDLAEDVANALISIVFMQ